MKPNLLFVELGCVGRRGLLQDKYGGRRKRRRNCKKFVSVKIFSLFYYELKLDKIHACMCSCLYIHNHVPLMHTSKHLYEHTFTEIFTHTRFLAYTLVNIVTL